MMKDMIDVYKNIIEQHIKDHYNNNNDFYWFEWTNQTYNYTEFKFRSTAKKYLAITGWIDNTDFEKTITYYIHPRIKGRKTLNTKLALLGFNNFEHNIPF